MFAIIEKTSGEIIDRLPTRIEAEETVDNYENSEAFTVEARLPLSSKEVLEIKDALDIIDKVTGEYSKTCEPFDIIDLVGTHSAILRGILPTK